MKPESTLLAGQTTPPQPSLVAFLELVHGQELTTWQRQFIAILEEGRLDGRPLRLVYVPPYRPGGR